MEDSELQVFDADLVIDTGPISVHATSMGRNGAVYATFRDELGPWSILYADWAGFRSALNGLGIKHVVQQHTNGVMHL